MMMNLFSMFDPSSSYIGLAWAPCLLPLVVLFSNLKTPMITKKSLSTNSISNFLGKEISSLMSPNEKKFSAIMLTSVFLVCITMNMIALTPFTFTPTAHLSISFSLALTFWLSFMVLGWTKNFSNMMAHLVPSGTPSQLMNFMVLIEMVSNLIRPITLSVRLSANMVAGHLLMSLLGSFLLLSISNLSALPLMLALSVLELGVSFIQAYVLMTLISLYSTEIH